LGVAYACGATTFSRLQRRIDSLERSYQRALRELQAIEVAKASACVAQSTVAQVPDLRPEIGFVPPKSAEPISPSRPPSSDLARTLDPDTLTPTQVFETKSRGL
jgi:hypothetical protein